MRQHHCLKCKNEIPIGRRLCDLHRQRRAEPSRATHAPMWDRILAPAANGRYSRIITTSDILALREKSLISCTGAEFEMAADLASMWNRFLDGQPIASAVSPLHLQAVTL